MDQHAKGYSAGLLDDSDSEEDLASFLAGLSSKYNYAAPTPSSVAKQGPAPGQGAATNAAKQPSSPVRTAPAVPPTRSDTAQVSLFAPRGASSDDQPSSKGAQSSLLASIAASAQPQKTLAITSISARDSLPSVPEFSSRLKQLQQGLLSLRSTLSANPAAPAIPPSATQPNDTHTQRAGTTTGQTSVTQPTGFSQQPVASALAAASPVKGAVTGAGNGGSVGSNGAGVGLSAGGDVVGVGSVGSGGTDSAGSTPDSAGHVHKRAKPSDLDSDTEDQQQLAVARLLCSPSHADGDAATADSAVAAADAGSARAGLPTTGPTVPGTQPAMPVTEPGQMSVVSIGGSSAGSDGLQLFAGSGDGQPGSSQPRLHPSIGRQQGVAFGSAGQNSVTVGSTGQDSVMMGSAGQGSVTVGSTGQDGVCVGSVASSLSLPGEDQHYYQDPASLGTHTDAATATAALSIPTSPAASQQLYSFDPTMTPAAAAAAVAAAALSGGRSRAVTPRLGGGGGSRSMVVYDVNHDLLDEATMGDSGGYAGTVAMQGLCEATMGDSGGYIGARVGLRDGDSDGGEIAPVALHPQWYTHEALTAAHGLPPAQMPHPTATTASASIGQWSDIHMQGAGLAGAGPWAGAFDEHAATAPALLDEGTVQQHTSDRRETWETESSVESVVSPVGMAGTAGGYSATQGTSAAQQHDPYTADATFNQWDSQGMHGHNETGYGIESVQYSSTMQYQTKGDGYEGGYENGNEGGYDSYDMMRVTLTDLPDQPGDTYEMAGGDLRVAGEAAGLSTAAAQGVQVDFWAGASADQTAYQTQGPTTGHGSMTPVLALPTEHEMQGHTSAHTQQQPAPRRRRQWANRSPTPTTTDTTTRTPLSTQSGPSSTPHDPYHRSLSQTPDTNSGLFGNHDMLPAWARAHAAAHSVHASPATGSHGSPMNSGAEDTGYTGDTEAAQVPDGTAHDSTLREVPFGLGVAVQGSGADDTARHMLDPAEQGGSIDAAVELLGGASDAPLIALPHVRTSVDETVCHTGFNAHTAAATDAQWQTEPHDADEQAHMAGVRGGKHGATDMLPAHGVDAAHSGAGSSPSWAVRTLPQTQPAATTLRTASSPSQSQQPSPAHSAQPATSPPAEMRASVPTSFALWHGEEGKHERDSAEGTYTGTTQEHGQPQQHISHAADTRGPWQHATQHSAAHGVQGYVEAVHGDSGVDMGGMWHEMNRQLMEAGFPALVLSSKERDGVPLPDVDSVLQSLKGVLHQYTRRQKLVQDLLQGMEMAARTEQDLQRAVMDAQREAAAAQKAATRAQQRADELASQLLPRTKAELQAQQSKLHNEVTRLKDQIKYGDAQLAAKDQEVRDLTATVHRLQVAAQQDQDTGSAALRAKLTQLETLIKTKDKELERMRLAHNLTQYDTTTDRAVALERAFTAEDTAQRLTAEVAQLRAKLQQTEQASAQRERELVSAIEDSDTRLSRQLAALTAMETRATSAEDSARGSAAEAAQYKAKVASLESTLRACQKENAKLKADLEGARGAAYDEVYRAEDEIRALKDELASRSARVSHLDNVIKAKEREITRVREEREAARAADRERTKVAEDVAARVEVELQAMKQKAAQLESALRTSQREVKTLEESLRSAKGYEYDTLVKQTKTEEGAKKAEQDLTQTKMRTLQLESQLKARDREVTSLTRQMEGLQAELYECESKLARTEELAKQTDTATATYRSKCLLLESTLRVKDREVERIMRLLEAAKVSEANHSTQIRSLEDTNRKLEGDLASWRVRVTQLEAQVKSKESALDKVHRQLDVVRREEQDQEVMASRTEEAARKVNEDAASLRVRIQQLEALVKTKDREMDKSTRRMEACRAAEYEATAQKLQLEEVIVRMETELSQAKQAVTQAESTSQARQKEIDRLTKLMDMVKASEFNMSVQLVQCEEATKSAVEELTAANRRVQSAESALIAKDKEINRLKKQIDDLQRSLSDAAALRSKLETNEIHAKDECATLRQRIGTMDNTLRTKEREVDRLQRHLEAAKGSEYQTLAQGQASEEAARKLDEQMAQVRHRVTQLEASLRTRDSEIERLHQSVSSAQAQEASTALRAAEGEETAKRLDTELGAMRSKLIQAENNTKTRDRQLDRLQKMLEAAKGDQLECEQRRFEAEAECRQVAEELSTVKQRLAQAEQQVRAKERQLERARKAMDGTKTSETEIMLKQERAEEEARQAAQDLANTRQQLVQMEHSLKACQRELERQQKHTAAARASEREADSARIQSEDALRELQSELDATKQHCASLEAALRARDKDVTGLQHLLEKAKGNELMASAHRARAEDVSKTHAQELTSAKARVVQLESQLLARDKALERSRKALTDLNTRLDNKLVQESEVLKQVEAKLDAFKTHSTQLQDAIRARDKKIAGLERRLSQWKAEGCMTEAERLRGQQSAQEMTEALAALRARMLALESEVQSKSREVDKARRALETARSTEEQMQSRQLQLEDTLQRVDNQASQARQRIIQLNQAAKAAAVRAQRQDSALAAALAAEEAAHTKRAEAEEACRRMEAELQGLQQKLVQAEGRCRSQEREVSFLTRQLNNVKKDEWEASTQAALASEAARKLDTDVLALRTQLKSVETSLKARDSELHRLQRQLSATKETETLIQQQSQQTDDAFRQLDQDLSAMKSHILTLERTIAGKDLEIKRLTKSLETSRAAELAAELRWEEAEGATAKAKEETLTHKQQIAQMDASVRAAERQADKAQRALEAAQAAQAAAELRCQHAESSQQDASLECARWRQKAAQSEAQIQAKERELERMKQLLEATKGATYDTDAQRLATEAAARQLDSDLSASRARITQLEASLRAKDKEVVRLNKQLDTAHAAEAQLVRQKADLEEAEQQLRQETANLRHQITQLETQLRGKDKELTGVQRQADATKAAAHDTTAAKLQTEDLARALSDELAAAKQRVIHLESQLKSRDKDIERLQRSVDAVKASELETEVARAQQDEVVRGLRDDLAAAKQRVIHLESQLKSRDRECERLQRSVDAARAGEMEAEVARAQQEGIVRSKDQELASLRTRISDQETSIRTKDKELDKAQRQLQAAKAAETQLELLRVEGQQALSATESDMAALKVKVSQLEGSLRLKDKEVSRSAAAAESALSKAQELQAQVSKAESAASKATEEAAGARGRAALLDGTLKVKDREIERLTRALDAARATEHELTSAHLSCQEAMRQLDEQLVTHRQRVTSLESQVKAREQDIDRLNKQLEEARSSELDAASKQLQSEDMARQLDGDVISLRQQILKQEGLLRSRNRQIDQLTRQLESVGGASSTELKELQLTVQKLQSDLATARSKAVAADTSLRGSKAEVSRLQKLVESLRASETEFSARAASAEESARQAQTACEAAKRHSAQLESQVRSLEQDRSRQREAVERSIGEAQDASCETKKTNEELSKAQSDLATARQRLQQLTDTVKTRDKEIERLQRLIDSGKSELSDALVQAAKSEEQIKKNESAAGSLRGRLAHVEAALRVRDREVERLSKLLGGAQAQGQQVISDHEDLTRRVSEEMSEASRRITLLEGQIKARDKDTQGLQKTIEGLKASLAAGQADLSTSQASLTRTESDLQTSKQRVTQLEGQLKSRDKEVERLTRSLQSAKSDAADSELVTGRSAQRMSEENKRLEATLAQTQARVTQLESALASREREIATLQKSDAWRRDNEAETAVGALERAAKAEEQLKRVESELTQVKARAVHLEHTLRNRELSVDKLRAALADKVTREERVVARDKQVYTRLKSAFAAHKANLQGKSAAGAVAAAARELRPVEIVGVYEQQRETLEYELAVAKKEVRLLSDQLRDAQNLIALKDRTGGWRNPAADAEIQDKIRAYEKRIAELVRELSSSRDQSADTLRGSERRVAEAERRAQTLSEENAALLAELHARPTVQENRSLKREVEILEKRIMDLRQGVSGGAGAGGGVGGGSSGAIAAAGAAADGGELALGVQRAGSRSALTSRDRIKRDKEVHRLGLRAVEDLPRDVLVDLMQDVCIELDVSDATLLQAACRKLMRVVTAVPRMEAFIVQVCETVYVSGERYLPPALRGGPQDPNKVISVLQSWLQSLHEHSALLTWRDQLTHALSDRHEPAAAAAQPSSLQELVASVRQLVAVEAQALAGQAALGAAAAHLASAPPTDVLAATIRHFQELFECPRLEGVVPTINKVYLSWTEHRNFLHTLCTHLNLPPGTTTAACAAAVQAALASRPSPTHNTNTLTHPQSQGSHNNTTNTTNDPNQLRDDYRDNKGPLGALVSTQQGTTGVAQGAGGGGGGGGVGGMASLPEELREAVTKLQQLFNAAGPVQLVAAAERLVARLRRLDEVLPRYQSVMSQLYEILRVRVIEEVVPAVTQLVSMQR